MRKEVIFALILGGLIGGIILYGIKLANEASIPGPQTENQLRTEQPTPSPKATTDLIISTPENHSVHFETPIPLKGSSLPGSTIVIVADGDEKIIDTDEQGSFETTIKLIGGENNILINSFSSDTLIASASVQVIYTTTVIE